jgi:transposase
MSLKATPVPPVPEETARVASTAFRKGKGKGSPWIALRDELGALYQDSDFSSLFAIEGRPAEAPWRLALVTCFQFAEGLSDRQAADAVRSRIDWKYALSLSLDDPGFDDSVLSEFRMRLIEGQAEALLFDKLIELCRERKWLKARGRQRTDSTYVLSSIHSLNRLEQVAQTLQHALNAVATVAPDWMRARLESEWGDWPERYDRRIDEYLLPKEEGARTRLAVEIGLDGHALLDALEADPQMACLLQAPAITTLRRVWLQRYYTDSKQTQWRTEKEHGLAPGAARIISPHDVEARSSTKREMSWEGYKVHLTESCDEDLPHLITQVETTPATTPDHAALPKIQQDLAAHDLLPDEQLVDSGYIEAGTLVESQRRGVKLCGPARPDTSWQGRANSGFAAADFHYDFARRVATCPAGRTSCSWQERHDRYGGKEIQIKFATRDCKPCPQRAQCTQTACARRLLTIQPEAEFHALQEARRQEVEPGFKKRYAARAGIEGTISQGVRRSDIRRARYVGQAKTHLQNVCTAVALNLVRLWNWLAETPLATTRRSAFAKCCQPKAALA